VSLVFQDLGELVNFKGGGTPSRNVEEYWNSSIPWATVKDLNEGITLTETQEFISELGLKNSASNLITKGTIIIPTRMALGKVVISEIDVAINQDLKAVFVKDKEKLDVKYLLRFLESNKENIASMGKGATVKGITLDQLKAIKIPLPPLVEQRRIASILDQADELRQKRQQAIEKLDQLLQATFIDMFGDPEKNPKKWNKVVLGDICDQKDRVNYGVVQPGNEFEGGVPLIRVGDIDGGILSFHLIKRIDPEIEKDYSRSRIKGNEVLVSCVGSIGTIAKVPNEAIGFNIARAITRVPLQDKRIINFVAECLKTEAIQNYFKKNTRTVSQPTLNVSFVKETEIIFPNEEKILDFCKIVDKVEFQKELLQKALVMQESLFQSLQNQAFNGTL
jgi:type I restriction enzyme S subunit